MVEVRSSVYIEMLSVQGYYAEESAETLKVFRNEAEEWKLRYFFGRNLKRNDGSYAERTVVSIAKVGA